MKCLLLWVFSFAVLNAEAQESLSEIDTNKKYPDHEIRLDTVRGFSIDTGLKKSVQKGKGEVFLNATDIAHTLRLKNEIQGDGFKYISTDYYETQAIRIGYSYKF